MFREIDVNGDQSMEWTEFTSYLVELASSYYEDQHSGHSKAYRYAICAALCHSLTFSAVYLSVLRCCRYSDVQDYTHHDYHVDYCKYFPGMGMANRQTTLLVGASADRAIGSRVNRSNSGSRTRQPTRQGL